MSSIKSNLFKVCKKIEKDKNADKHLGTFLEFYYKRNRYNEAIEIIDSYFCSKEYHDPSIVNILEIARKKSQFYKTYKDFFDKKIDRFTEEIGLVEFNKNNKINRQKINLKDKITKNKNNTTKRKNKLS